MVVALVCSVYKQCDNQAYQIVCGESTALRTPHNEGWGGGVSSLEEAWVVSCLETAEASSRGKPGCGPPGGGPSQVSFIRVKPWF